MSKESDDRKIKRTLEIIDFEWRRKHPELARIRDRNEALGRVFLLRKGSGRLKRYIGQTHVEINLQTGKPFERDSFFEFRKPQILFPKQKPKLKRNR